MRDMGRDDERLIEEVRMTLREMDDRVTATDPSTGRAVRRARRRLPRTTTILVLSAALVAYAGFAAANASGGRGAHPAPAAGACSSSWKVMASPNAPTGSSALNAVAAAGPHDVWA